MDSSFIDEERRDPYTRVRQLASVSNRRTSDWPFLFTSDHRGITINRPPLKKKSGDPFKEIGEALL